ncbi:response regulator transcription factor [Pseudochryseolinea flava]|uniref:DNA-binding response regulator n=1 Tax=Pseudochryseolinea flava TaxID=2059302 RepID=A0A364Y5R4_9BACT|nr:response regulator transcription factor [Pseudochryseolinea flava]RAW02336.1 DNA-binding response regulator [Pseudochryseolinea flava]
MKILLIEDEDDLRDVMKISLEKELFLIETASDFHTAAEKLETYDYDCILLDIMLPGGSGLTLLELLKEKGKHNSVIIISAKNSIDDKVRGLNLGADDYLTKPFHLAELTARVKSVIRRKQHDGQKIINIGNVKINLNERTVNVQSSALILNRKEFDILVYFASNKNRLINKTALAEHIWGDHADQSDDFEFIYSQIKNLRKKLKETDASIEIQAVYGIGYKLVVE